MGLLHELFILFHLIFYKPLKWSLEQCFHDDFFSSGAVVQVHSVLATLVSY